MSTQQLHLLQSTCESKNHGNIILDLNTVISIKLYHYVPDDHYALRVECENGSHEAWFHDEEEIRAETTDILLAMNNEPDLAKWFNIIRIEQDVRHTIDQIKEIVSSSTNQMH